MQEIIYLFTFWYIGRCIKGIYYSRHKSIEAHELLKAVNPFTDKSIQDRMHDISHVNEKAKSKKGKLFLDLIDLIWTIWGIAFAIESMAFISLLVIDIIARFILMIMIKSSIQSHIPIQRNIILANIISIILCFIIAYNHFINPIFF